MIFRDFNDDVLKVEEVPHNGTATPPTSPQRQGYVFAGWDRILSNVTAPMVVTARYALPTAPMLTVADATAKPGDTVTLDVSITNNPGLLGAILTYNFDPALTLTAAEAGPALDPLDVSFSPYGTPFTAFCDGITEAADTDGVMMRLTFTVPKDAAVGQSFAITASHHLGDVVDSALKDVELIMVSGTVTIQ